MYFLRVLFITGCIAIALGQNAGPSTQKVETLNEKSYVREDGYNFEFQTSDGVSRKEEANLITVGDHQGIGVKGSYSYVGPDGQEYQVTFTADQNGYKPTIHVVPAQGSQ